MRFGFTLVAGWPEGAYSFADGLERPDGTTATIRVCAPVPRTSRIV